MPAIPICDVGDLEDKGKIVVDVGDEKVGIFRLGDEFYAWKNVCPHQGGPVCQGRLYDKVVETLHDDLKSKGREFDTDGKHIVCPWHGLEFDIRSGEFAGASSTQVMSLTGYNVKVENGVIYVLT